MTKLISWNVNGIRAVMKKGFADFLAEEAPDILCLQETKISSDLLESIEVEGFPHQTWNCAEKKGYSGTALLSKHAPLNVSTGLGPDFEDREGRVITAEFEDYFLVTVYTPNAQNELRRLDYRIEAWDKAFRAHLTTLRARKPVIFCGDLNVAYQEIDLANPKSNRRNAGFTDEERTSFGQYLKDGFVDTFRHFYPDTPNRYSWWSYRAGARTRNVGWRIDYFCASSDLLPKLKDAEILDQVAGSDHCPVRLITA